MCNDTDVKRKRIRLRPEVRREQILQATLAEFSAHGYAASSVEKIAQRAGLSKAGIYAHFSGKEEIFEALLMKVLVPSFTGFETHSIDGESLEDIVDVFISTMYDRLEDQTFLAVFRLMIAEGGRAPHLLKRWRNEVIKPYLDQQQTLLDRCVERGVVRASAVAANYALVLAPSVFGSLLRLLSDEDVNKRELAQLRDAHRQFLMETLQP
ncbi:TetR/AcrR family transcriptional regulator [Pusillimonas sp. ANT_WB101]|uniref:TetR/AcrR family transcriptional regulator n=1 Tax=Pusillimonas sp. ANT_WB101 TaxID=2597356 RepID=UPI0011EF1463|nr:TetR/AcrR family transcriptional regulator [Pusillimonas sp. ANT_WB101]KAA0910841.1 TetR/AcrR family transcriptional regulator [Pusillimonas sp. ANT_WB101]